MQKPEFETILKLLADVAGYFDALKVEYLVYGSVAYLLYTNDLSLMINDIDIIVKKTDFEAIKEIFDNNNLPYNLVVSENAIHANHKALIGNNETPFDISLDSYEYYFKDTDIKFEHFTHVKIEGTDVKLLPKEQLIKVYENKSEQTVIAKQRVETLTNGNA